jgi:peroxiredoxin
MPHDFHDLPPNLPVPVDDGATRHLPGSALPDFALPSTAGIDVALRGLAGPTVLFFYPRTGEPGHAPGLGFAGEAWDDIPGARGCTPQSCGFRDAHAGFREMGVTIFGVSTQDREYQRAFQQRNHIAFDFLSDEQLTLTRALSLPTFEFPVESGGPNTLIKRMSWLVLDGTIRHVWYPVFPPNENAARVLAWLRENPIPR